NTAAVERGIENLKKHIENVQQFDVPIVVALNRFTTDTDDEIGIVQDACSALGVVLRVSSVWKEGGKGGMAVAEAILAEMASHRQSRFHHLYPDDLALDSKLDVIARRLYGADGINLLPAAAAKLSRFERHGYRALPICVAKTQNSLSDDPR